MVEVGSWVEREGGKVIGRRGGMGWTRRGLGGLLVGVVSDGDEEIARVRPGGGGGGDGGGVVVVMVEGKEGKGRLFGTLFVS